MLDCSNQPLCSSAKAPRVQNGKSHLTSLIRDILSDLGIPATWSSLVQHPFRSGCYSGGMASWPKGKEASSDQLHSSDGICQQELQNPSPAKMKGLQVCTLLRKAPQLAPNAAGTRGFNCTHQFVAIPALRLHHALPKILDVKVQKFQCARNTLQAHLPLQAGVTPPMLSRYASKSGPSVTAVLGGGPSSELARQCRHPVFRAAKRLQRIARQRYIGCFFDIPPSSQQLL